MSKPHLKTPVAGVGTNDADYDVHDCRYYSRWSGMLKRCYNQRELNEQPCYRKATVCEEWKDSFLAFRSWMEQQDWQGKELDKDFKGDGTLYSPDTCLFIPQWLNALFPICEGRELPTGVCLDKRTGAFRATLSTCNKQVTLGNYKTVREAESAYIHAKMNYVFQRGLDANLLSLVAKRFKKIYPRDYVYCASAMRGVPEFNFPAFDRAAERLRADGFIVFNPADRDRATGFDPSGMTGNEDLAAMGFCLREALHADTSWICLFATHIYMLKGWEKSSGARAEHALALALGLQVMYEH